MTNTQQIRKISTEINNIKKELQSVGQPTDLKSKWMTGIEVGHALGMSAKTLQRLRQCGALPFSKVHGKIYFKRSDVEQMLEDNYQKVTRYCGCR